MADVPQVPGVPALSSFSTSNIPLLVADAIALVDWLLGPQWGIFLDGAQAFSYNSIVDFEYRKEFAIADYQIEGGAFQSYDKVEHPFDVKVRVASGGTSPERQQLLREVETAANSLNLYTVVTPEKAYASCNIAHLDYKRTAVNGVGCIIIDIWFQQIRESATANFDATKTPVVSGQENTGSVTAATPSAATSGSFPSGQNTVQ